MGRRQIIGIVLGPLLFLLVQLLPRPEGMSAPAASVAACAALMATWWITEAIPIPATALIPIALFPLLGIMEGAEVTTSYANHLIYLYLGGFLIAVCIERWNLHRRIALLTIRIVGVSPRRILLGFMLATAGLSMWISNTATTMMMLPIGLAVVRQAASMSQPADKTASGTFSFGTSLMLGIAYAASIGGIATPIGTPPNAILLGVVENAFGQTIRFVDWMTVGIPLSAMMLVLTWFYLTRLVDRSELHTLPGGRGVIEEEYRRLGRMSREERRVLSVFALVAAAWILRGFLHLEWLSMVEDSTIAVFGAVALFLIPSDLKAGRFLLDWQTAVRIPWDVIILFGGGFALANGFSSSGLTPWIAQSLHVFQGTSPILLIAAVCYLVIFLTEITSNAATASLTLPVVAAFAQAMEIHPYGLMIPVALAASFAFMLPVATPPNAIVFSSRAVTIPQMSKAGFLLNLMGGVLILSVVLAVLPLLWGIDLYRFPSSFLP